MRVEKHMIADPHRRIGKLVVDVVVPGPLSKEDHQVLLTAMEGCPVKRSLHSDVGITTRIGHAANL